MSKLLEHAEVVADCKVLDNFRLFQAKAMNMLDCELPAIGSQGWPMQRGDDVLNDSPNVRVLDTEIGELRRKELVSLLGFPAIPKLLKVALSSIHLFATVEAGKNTVRPLILPIAAI